ncbi:type VII secretion-associated serine protease mycosin [Actinoplanes sp. NPDC051859]|uniref:type VII secretion-associated serine protease mycosin n=1 Tax=Actinoplanes sp. NPDC051859 TaxID=3363909 RepID=UPI0037947574
MTFVTGGGRVFAAALIALGIVASWSAPAAAADEIRGKQWHLSALRVGDAHQITQGDGLTVAVIDSGVARHQDLTNAVLAGGDLVNPDGGDGRSDSSGHGTSMAGVIVGRGHGADNGVLGLAPAAKILPIRIATNSFNSSKQLADAISMAVARGARVINMSIGGGDDEPIRAAIRAAQAADVVLVAASGNRGDYGDNYPGKYPEVLTVGAVDRSGKVADFSVTGPQVDLVAPGVDIVTTGNTETGYVRGKGTSHATAVVSGAAALIRARFPEMSAAEVVHRLTATAVDAGAEGRDDVYGYGRLDLMAALTAEVPPAPPTVVPSASTQPVQVEAGGGRTPVKRVSPLVIAGGAALVVLLIGGGVVALLVRRR